MTTEVLKEKICPDLSDPLREKVQKHALLVFVIVSACFFAFVSPRMAWSVFVGGAIGFLNFRDLRKTLEKAFALLLKEGSNVGPFLVARYYLKLLIVFALLFALLKKDLVDVAGLIIGLSLLPLSFLGAGITTYLGFIGGKTK